MPLIACGLIACGSQAVHPPGEEWLQSIQFEGNEKLSSKSLLTGLTLHRTQKAGEAADPYLVQADAERLRGQYLRAGYFDVDVQARVERKGDAATVIYTIKEGTRATTHVEISGLPDDPAVEVAAVRKKLPLADGKPFEYAKYDAAKERLIVVLQDAGYAHATLDASVIADPPTHTATISLAFTPGPKCRFGTIRIQGVDGDLKQAIEERLHFATGTTYSHRAIARTQRDIYGMARFSTVQVQPDPGDSELVNVTIAVSESGSRQITLGGGFGMDPLSYEVRGRAGYSITGWPFPLDTVSVDLRPAYGYLRDGSGYQPRMRALARLERLDLFLPYAIGSVEVGFDYLAYEAYTEYGPRAQLDYAVRLGSPRITLDVGWMIGRYDFRNISVLIDPALQMQIGIDHIEQVAAFKQALVADLRDHPVDPRLGWYAALQISEGGPFAAGQYTYQQVTPDLRGYVPIGSVVLAARARVGAFYGDVPPTERYYGGGATSQRGFSERRLSPSVTGPVMGSTLTVPYGGAGMIDTSVEARVPIATVRETPIGGVVFLDGGDVTETPSDLTLGRLNWAVGLGVRVKTIVGPLRLDVGYRLNRTGPTDPEPGSRWAFHLSLGEAY